jgi:hypothetical protein
MKLHAQFTATFGWCPPVRGLSNGEMELGLMANLQQVRANQSLDLTQGISASLNAESLALLLERAGASEKDIVRVKMEAFKSDMESNRGSM